MDGGQEGFCGHKVRRCLQKNAQKNNENTKNNTGVRTTTPDSTFSESTISPPLRNVDSDSGDDDIIEVMEAEDNVSPPPDHQSNMAQQLHHRFMEMCTSYFGGPYPSSNLLQMATIPPAFPFSSQQPMARDEPVSPVDQRRPNHYSASLGSPTDRSNSANSSLSRPNSSGNSSDSGSSLCYQEPGSANGYRFDPSIKPSTTYEFFGHHQTTRHNQSGSLMGTISPSLLSQVQTIRLGKENTQESTPLSPVKAPKQRSAKKPVPEAQKDGNYYTRRNRNNKAAKKSRETTKQKDAIRDEKLARARENHMCLKLQCEMIAQANAKSTGEPHLWEEVLHNALLLAQGTKDHKIPAMTFDTLHTFTHHNPDMRSS